MDSVTVDSTDTGLTGRSAILDTGTTLIVAPPADAAAVHQLIDGAQDDGQGGFTIPCDTNATVALTFGGQEFAIDTRDLVFAQADNTGTTCVSGISSGQIVDDTTWLVSSPTLLLPLCVLLTCGGLRVSACAGRRCVLEERVLLDRRDEEPDLACEARLKARARLLPCHASLCARWGTRIAIADTRTFLLHGIHCHFATSLFCCLYLASCALHARNLHNRNKLSNPISPEGLDRWWDLSGTRADMTTSQVPSSPGQAHSPAMAAVFGRPFLFRCAS